MQFEDLDKKYREAAEHHHPAYDNKAWSKMEKLLDQHMPQKDNRRRFLFLLFLVLLLGSAGMLVLKPWINSKSVTASKTSTASATTSNSSGTTSSSPDNKLSPVNEQSGYSTEEQILTPEPTATDILSQSGSIQKKDDVFTQTFKQAKQKMFEGPFTGSKSKAALTQENEKSIGPVNTVPPATSVSNVEPTSTIATNANSSTQKLPVTTSYDSKTADKQAENKSDEPVATPAKSKSKDKDKKASFFFVSLGGGPDISFVKSHQPGKLKLFGGASLGYTFREKLTVRAGFYSGRKVYDAKASDYNPPPVFYTYYPYLQDVEANCVVYEVPVSVSYNFANTNKKQLFVSAGLSSYFMKKEDYKYFYKNTPTGPTVSRDYQFKNEHQHLFAGITLSGGYTRKIARNVSVTAEPYLKLPLEGVGYGKVKLNSAGVLFSVGVTPFSGKIKK